MLKIRLIICIGVILFLCGDAVAKTDVEVTGIIHKDTPIAIINNKIMQEGDEIDGYLLEKIGNNYVNLRYKNKLIVKNVTGKRLHQETELLKTQNKNMDKKQIQKKFQKGSFPLVFSLVVLIIGGFTFFLSSGNKNNLAK